MKSMVFWMPAVSHLIFSFLVARASLVLLSDLASGVHAQVSIWFDTFADLTSTVRLHSATSASISFSLLSTLTCACAILFSGEATRFDGKRRAVSVERVEMNPQAPTIQCSPKDPRTRLDRRRLAMHIRDPSRFSCRAGARQSLSWSNAPAIIYH